MKPAAAPSAALSKLTEKLGLGPQPRSLAAARWALIASAPAPIVPVPDGLAHPEKGIDRTVKLYVGGAQKRPDGGASYEVQDELVPLGGRKDIRNAVEAAQGALGLTPIPGATVAPSAASPTSRP